MNVRRPKFIESPFFVMEKGNWHLKEGAPEDVVQEFNDYMSNEDESGRTEK